MIPNNSAYTFDVLALNQPTMQPFGWQSGFNSDSMAVPYIPWGNDNLEPNRLLTLKQQSAIHNAILDLKIDLTAGDGLEFSDATNTTSKATQTKYRTSIITETKEAPWLDAALISSVGADFNIFGGFALQIVWSKTGNAISHVQHVPFSTLRVEKPTSLAPDTTSTGYYYSADWVAWHNYRTLLAKPQRFAAYNPALAKTAPIQILWYRCYQPEATHYPIPNYGAAQQDIAFDVAYAQFRLATMQNGMFPSLHLNVESSPTEDEKALFYSQIKAKLTGTRNAGDVLITYGYPNGGAVTINPIPNNANADIFSLWAEDSRQRIITGHRLTSPVMAGLPSTHALGSNNSEISVAFEYFNNTVVLPIQQQIIKTLNKLLVYTKAGLKVANITSSRPLKYIFSEALLATILTRTELRQEAGYAADNRA